VRSSPRHEALVRFSEESVWGPDNPWTAARDHVIDRDREIHPDVLFLSGVDWAMIDRADWADSPVPVVNLIQHVWHAAPNDRLGRSRFLPNKAIRICVSPEVTRALERTGRVRGPIFTIPNGVDFELLSGLVHSAPPELDVLVIANKQPQRGQAVFEQLAGAGRTHIVDTRSPRTEVLDLIAKAAVTVFVPNPKEGFFLPALEGMALGTVVVCPDCVGNRSYCIDRVNCFRPAYSIPAIVADAREALARRDDLGGIAESAAETARRHDLRHERAAFLEVLDRVEELWETA
jgi:glycosyltransferase involved in cell wall biosynthesis